MSKKYYLVIAVLGLFITTLSVSSITAAAEGWQKRLENMPEEKKEEFLEKKEAWEAKKAEGKIKHEALREIIEAEDYDAWVVYMTDLGKDSEFTTEENFAKFIEMHQLMQEGKVKLAEAKEIAEELGLHKTGKRGKGFMKRAPHAMFAGEGDHTSDED